MQRTVRMTAAIATLMCAAALCGCQTTKSTPIDDPSTQEGLVRAEVKGVDAVYRKPQATLAAYNKLLLTPVQVHFAKNWEKDLDSSALYRMNKPDREKIKTELAAAFADVFKRELETKGGYQIVSEPAEDVLEVEAAIVNLYINAPDVSMQTTGRTKTYTADAGQMTLLAELRDSVTGELLGRVYDHDESLGTGTWQWTNSVTNTAEARRIIAAWADTLRKAMDAARGKTN